jgi:hypothetical protein
MPYTYFVSYSHVSPTRGSGSGATSVVLAEPVVDWDGVEELTAAVFDSYSGTMPLSAIVILNFILLSGPKEA